MIRIGLQVAFCIGFISSAWSQAAPGDTQKPVAPFVQAVPSSADWVMKVKPLQAQQPGTTDATSAKVGGVTAIHFTKVGATERVILTLSSGETQEYYNYQNFHLIPTTVPGRIFVSPHVPTAPPYPYYAKGFYGVDWLSADTFVGIESRDGVKCFYFKLSRPNPLAGVPNLPTEALAESKKALFDEAWIDCATKLPVAVTAGGETLGFVFGTPPVSLPLPPAQKAAWATWQEQVARLEAMKVP